MRVNKNIRASGSVTVNVDGFSGIGERVDADGKSLYRSENMSGKLLPSLSVRNRRSIVRAVSSSDGIFADDALGWVENGSLYYAGEQLTGVRLSPGKKQVLRLGRYLFVFPDCVYINTVLPSDSGSVFSEITVPTVSVALCREDLSEINGYLISDSEPTEADAGTYLVLYKNGAYISEMFDGYVWKRAETFVRLSADHIGAGFRVGDVLEVTGLENITGEKSITVAYRTDGAIYFSGSVPGITGVTRVGLRRPMPLLDYVTESGGRLWGCRSGFDRDGNLVSGIYASAEGDPTFWSVHAGGIETRADGSGAFTGICDHRGMPVVFRENTITEVRISGKRVLTSTFECDGLEAGAEKSPVTVGGILYYKSRGAVCSYDGSYPRRISFALGGVLRAGGNGCPAGKQNGRYYVKLSKNGKERIYVYDTVSRCWFVEDDPGIVGFAERRGALYALFDTDPANLTNFADHANSAVLYDTAGISGSVGASGTIGAYDTGSSARASSDIPVPASRKVRGIMMMDPSECPAWADTYCIRPGYPVYEDKVKWYFETGNIAGEIFEGKIPRRLGVRLRKEKGSNVKAGVIYGGDIGNGNASDADVRSWVLRSVPLSGDVGCFGLPVSVKKCDSVRLCMSGTGDAEIIGYSLEYGKGSEKGIWN